LAGGGANGRWEGPRKLRLLAGAALVAALLPLTACGGNPPQIVDYSPLRGSLDVSTAAPVRITFDHDVDQASVESRLRMAPSIAGSVHWLNGHQLTYEHPTLQPSTTYEVILESGYRDLAGNVYSLRHHWSFVTEAQPSLVGATPANGDRGVDPAAYLALNFSRGMDAASLAGAITLYPSVPIDVRLDPTDNRRAIIAPSQLLSPGTAYQLAVNTAALDADGNQLDRDQTIDFTTGAMRPLHGWITFAVDNPDGAAGGAWIVDAQGFPRRLYDTGPVHSFSWSPSGDRLLLQGDNDTWSEFVPGGDTTPLPFTASWASALAPGMGYVYIDDARTLHRLAANGADEVIAADVTQAAVAPGGLRVAFVQGGNADNQVWGYDVGLRARYQLALDTAPVSDVTWAPAGNRIAYLRSDPQATSLRVRNLSGSASTTTVASGDLGPPAWLPDSLHLVFAAGVPSSGGAVHKAFIVNVVTPPANLTAALGLPANPGVDVASPVPSPDGHQIAFISGNQVWLMNADGTRPTPLTQQDPASFPYSCRMPAWTRT
jgi:hypothetical protein